QRIQRNDCAFQRLLNVAVSRELPDFLSEVQVALEELVQISSRGRDPGLFDQSLQFCKIPIRCFGTCQINGKRLQFHAQIEDLLGVRQRQRLHMRSGKRGPLDETLVLQFDQSFTDEALADAKL